MNKNYHQGAANDGERAIQCDQMISDVNIGDTLVVGLNITEITNVTVIINEHKILVTSIQ